MDRWTDHQNFAAAGEQREEIASVHRAAIRSIQRVVSENATPHDEQYASEGIAKLLKTGKVLVLTGAGVSTESGIPDYRGPGGSLYDHRPMTYQEFRYDDAARQRYWARSYVGWRRMRRAEPNRAHYALAELEQLGAVSGVITQNVDGLHARAGSSRLLALHGDLSRIVCLDCGQDESRESLDARLDAANPGYLARLEDEDLRVNPDGDVELDERYIRDFQMVPCLGCGSTRLKPDVVYFGESVPAERKARKDAMLAECSALLVVGSSVAVMSSYKIVLEALRAGKPVAVINGGPGRADAKATYLWRSGVGEALELMLDEIDV